MTSEINKTIEKMKKLRRKSLKKRYNVTLDETDVEEIQILLNIGLSPALQFVMHEFLEDFKDKMEEEGDWTEEPITSEQRKFLDEKYKEDPERFGLIDSLSTMKKIRIEKGRYQLLKKEERYSKLKKEGGKKG